MTVDDHLLQLFSINKYIFKKEIYISISISIYLYLYTNLKCLIKEKVSLFVVIFDTTDMRGLLYDENPCCM